MKIYYEPIDVTQWNIFEEVRGIGHIEPFLATKSMRGGDLMVCHVGQQDKNYMSGVYAYGEIITEPYILENRPNDYCNNKLSVDVRIDYICYGTPLIDHEYVKDIIGQFRTRHVIKEEHYPLLLNMLQLDSDDKKKYISDANN